MHCLLFSIKSGDRNKYLKAWSELLTIMIYKKGNMTVPANYWIYCRKNGKLINTSKMKVLSFNKSGVSGRPGRPGRRCSTLAQTFSRWSERPNTWDWNPMLLRPLNKAVGKARIASGAVHEILCSGNLDDWQEKTKLCDPYIRDRDMGSGIYGKDWGSQVESYKRVLALPRCTPAYALRTDLGLLPLE